MRVGRRVKCSTTNVFSIKTEAQRSLWLVGMGPRTRTVCMIGCYSRDGALLLSISVHHRGVMMRERGEESAGGVGGGGTTGLRRGRSVEIDQLSLAEVFISNPLWIMVRVGRTNS